MRSQHQPRPSVRAHSGISTPRRAAQPASPKPRKPPGPAIFAPNEPETGKQRRRVLKAAAWRLARLLACRPSKLLVTEETALQDLIKERYGGQKRQGSERGDAKRLANKMMRLRRH
jgi:hypothetical protein